VAISYYFFVGRKEAPLEKWSAITDKTAKIEAPTLGESDNYRQTGKEAIEAASVKQTPIEQARRATVSIDTPWGSGSGFFITAQYIVTNRHVVEFDTEKLVEVRRNIERGREIIDLEKEKIIDLKDTIARLPDGPDRKQLVLILEGMQERLDKILPKLEADEEKLSKIEGGAGPSDIKVILSDGSEYSANYLLLSDNYDLALLSLYIEAEDYLQRPPSPGTLRPGDKVFVIGSPVGLRNTVTAGIFSGYREQTATNQRFLQTDAAINPGNSGGPLIDERGFVYGVNTMILRDTEGIGFAIPVEAVFEEFDTELYTN
jgi:S1-C subfamily serine protease